jgi:hypothetical protein
MSRSKYELEKEIIEVLKTTKYDAPMTVRDIAAIVGINESDMTFPHTRKLIKSAMKSFSMPIGSYYKGYYRIRSAHQMQRYRSAHQMQRYMNSLLKRQIGITERIDIVYKAFHGRRGN